MVINNVDLKMVEGLGIVDHLVAYAMNHFTKLVNSNEIMLDDDLKRKCIKQFQTVQESCTNRMYAHILKPEEDTMDRLMNATSAVSIFDEFLKLIELLKEVFKTKDIAFKIDTSNIITGLDYQKTYEYKKLMSIGVNIV